MKIVNNKLPLTGLFKGRFAFSIMSMIVIASFVVTPLRSIEAAVPNNRVTISVTQFDLTGDAAEIDANGQQSGVGVFNNGQIEGYPEGACLPVLLNVSHNDGTAGDIEFSVSYDFQHPSQDVTGVEELEAIDPTFSGNPATLADDLGDFVYSDANSAPTLFSTVTEFDSELGTVAATVSGPFGDDSGTDPIDPGDSQRHYNIILSSVDPNEDVYVVFCARFGLDAGEFPGSSMQVRMGSGGGAQTIAINANNILLLPSLTLSKTILSGTAAPDEFSFVISPAIDEDGDGTIDDGLIDLPTGDSTITIDNVPSGTYSITETGPAGYSFATGSGTSCTFSGETATATLAAGNPATDADCSFENSVDSSTITVTKVVVNNDGGSAVVSDFPLFVDATAVTSGVATAFPADTYIVSETNLPGYTATFSGDCDPITGEIVLGEGENLTCTITNDDQEGTLTVVKTVVDGPNVAADFDISLFESNGNLLNTTPGSETGTVHILQAGTYSVSESSILGYAGTFSGDCDANGNVTVTNGGSATCTLTNDYTAPAPGTGSLNVVKNVVNDDLGTETAASFTLTVRDSLGAEVDSFAGSETGVAVIDLAPGTYTVEETGPDGYTADWSACGDGTVTVTAGVVTDCTVVNDDNEPASITVIKNVINDGMGISDAGDFTMNIMRGTDVLASFPGDEAGTTVLVEAGDYEVTETPVILYTPSYDTGCEGTLAPGESVTCTVTNNDFNMPVMPTMVTVTKIVVNDDGGTSIVSDFDLMVGTTSVESGLPSLIMPGTYQVSETGPAGYTATFSGDCDSTGQLVVPSMSLGLSCTITNDDNDTGGGGGPTPDPEGTLTVTKVVVNDDAGTAVVSDFPLFVDATAVVSGVSQDFAPGTYTVSETNLGGYTASFSGDCDSNGQITIADGDDLECIITNDDDDVIGSGNLTVIVDVVNNSGGSNEAGDFSFTVDYNSSLFSTFVGEEDPGTAFVFAPGDFSVGDLVPDNSGYAVEMTGDCDGSIENGDDLTCVIIVDDLVSGGGGGGGGNGGGSSNDDDDAPTPDDTDTPDGIVLGDADEAEETPEGIVLGDADEAEETPDPIVLDATDELPRTGIPAYAVVLLALPLLWAARRDNK